MAYDLAKVTANGNNLIAQILANKSSLSIDKIEISDTQLSSTTDISTMTSVPKVVQTVSANGFSKNSNTLIISTVVDNSTIRADYKAWVFGIWGSDSQNGRSQLIAVITSTNSPDTIPAFSGRTPVSYTYKFNIGFSNASQIKFNMINDSFATNDTVVHTTGDETIDGQKKFKTDPTDSAGNAYAKTVDVNQQLDKKVNVSDMRKPASDVAGIEEVNAKQDKIGYTPADDSKVVHTTDTSNWQKQAMFNHGSYMITATLKEQLDFATLLKTKFNNAGIYYIRDDYKNSVGVVDSVTICEGGGWWYAYGVTPVGSKFVHRQINKDYDSGWVITADDSQVVHSTDMRKPASDVVGLEDVPQAIVKPALDSGIDLNTVVTPGVYPFAGISFTNYIDNVVRWGYLVVTSEGSIVTQTFHTPGIGMPSYRMLAGYPASWSPWTIFSDDSKVAHLSGANNFDTVPTVNNNPLLLASSLPSDLARTGSNQEFTGKNTFDTAPIDKTTGNPYITKDGVPSLPSDLARTGQAQTFTAAQTFSIAPTIKDASKDKGDNQAATMADLKSVEKSAWRPLIKNFDTNYFQNEKYYNFNAFIKVSGGKAQIVGYLQDRSGSSYPFGTYIRLANLPSGISFQNDIDNLGVNVQGILSSSFNDNIYSAAVDGTINAHSSDNSIGIIFQKDSNFNTNVDWFQPGTYGSMESYPTWTINGMTSDIKLSD